MKFLTVLLVFWRVASATLPDINTSIIGRPEPKLYPQLFLQPSIYLPDELWSDILLSLYDPNLWEYEMVCKYFFQLIRTDYPLFNLRFSVSGFVAEVLGSDRVIRGGRHVQLVTSSFANPHLLFYLRTAEVNFFEMMEPKIEGMLWRCEDMDTLVDLAKVLKAFYTQTVLNRSLSELYAQEALVTMYPKGIYTIWVPRCRETKLFDRESLASVLAALTKGYCGFMVALMSDYILPAWHGAELDEYETDAIQAIVKISPEQFSIYLDLVFAAKVLETGSASCRQKFVAFPNGSIGEKPSLHRLITFLQKDIGFEAGYLDRFRHRSYRSFKRSSMAMPSRNLFRVAKHWGFDLYLIGGRKKGKGFVMDFTKAPDFMVPDEPINFVTVLNSIRFDCTRDAKEVSRGSCYISRSPVPSYFS